MKKVLLSAFAVLAAMNVNAQVEIGAMTQEAVDAIFVGDPTLKNKDEDAEPNRWDIAANTVLLKTESVTCTNLYANDRGFGKTGLSKNDVKVNDVDFGSKSGIQGTVNPPANAATAGEFPTQGCVYHFVPSKNGYLYVIHKASANKNYVVFEEKTRIPYIFATADGSYDLSKIEGATVTNDGITTISPDYAIGQAQDVIGTSGKGAGTCVIKFQVFEGLGYDVLATGSKLTLAGFVFDTTGDATITTGSFDEGNLATLLDKGQIPGGEAGISSVKADKVNGAIFNLAGQKVAANFKGIAIQNGKKVVLK